MKSVISVLFFFVFPVFGIAQTGTAKIFLIREGMYEGAAAACSIFKDGELLCKLNNKRYSIHDVAPGKYTFHTQWGGNKPNKQTIGDITVTIEEGKTYYIKFNSVSKAFNGYIGLIEVTENTFKTIEPNLKLDDKCL
jgi:hypothetical protein